MRPATPVGPTVPPFLLNMKTNRFAYLLIPGLALALAVVGCNKRPGDLNTIPGQAGVPGDQGMNGLPPGQAAPSGDTNGVIPTAALPNPGDYNEDAQTLAADTVHFDYDSAAIKNSEQVHVEAVVAALRLDPTLKVRVEGNCDERGTEEYNRALGERRALAVREAMAKLGIDPERILTISYGEDKPVAPGHDESAWKQNRRADFVLLHPK